MENIKKINKELEIENKKYCKICKEIQLIDMFRPNSHICKPCTIASKKDYMKKYYDINSIVIKERVKQVAKIKNPNMKTKAGRPQKYIIN
jgi:hypothetical protein